MEPKKWDTAVRLGLIVLGNCVTAFAVAFFVLPNNILSGGVSSVAIALSPYIPVSRILIIDVLNIVLFFLGAVFLGKKFAVNSVLSSVLYPLFISLFGLLDTTPFEGLDPLMAALYAGLIMGAGLGLVFRANASTGGMDIPALILHKYARIPLNQCVLVVDTLTIMMGVYTYGIQALLVGLVSVMASSLAINWVSTLGSRPAKNVMIISEKWEDIKNYLLTKADRGVTILDARGAWTNQDRPVLMCVVDARQYARLERDLSALDPKAFIVVTDVHEVRGSGFTFKDGSLS